MAEVALQTTTPVIFWLIDLPMKNYCVTFFSCAAFALFFAVSEATAEPLVELSTASASSSVATSTETFSAPVSTAKLKVVSGFGRRKKTPPQKDFYHPVGVRIPADAEPHDGIDFAAAIGASVHAARGGKVLFAGSSKMYTSRDPKPEQSRFIIIQHSDGTSTRYVHLAAIRVKPMQMVSAGDVIATVSSSDEWAEPVLHFEVREANGHPIDPRKVLSDLKKP